MNRPWTGGVSESGVLSQILLEQLLQFFVVTAVSRLARRWEDFIFHLKVQLSQLW